MKKYTIYQIDSFTRKKFKGNPAGVVVNADGLSEKQMLMIARELNNSETAFIFNQKDKSCDGEIRYFTPTVEVPICGHATIAAMYAKAAEEHIENAIFNIKTKVGILPFEIQKVENDIKVWMTQGKIEIKDFLSQEYQNELFDNLGITSKDMHPDCPIQIASTGHSKVMIGIKSRRKLNALTPNFAGLANLSQHIKCNGYFVFTVNEEGSKILTHGRMFAPSIGINEDPVTGNANGPLGAYLVYNNLVNTDTEIFNFFGTQGEAIGRDGRVEVSVHIENKQPVLVRIAGEAVIVFKTTIKI
ncbi:MAG: PhzF family isomerase [Desulfopila sp.]|jgi:PhzF family phenazine biosynthesis protein|nr:PhzF family isomerase [Desulfopila sp.]